MIYLSLFNRLIGNKSHSFKVNDISLDNFQNNINYDISPGIYKSSDEKEVFYGHLSNGSFDLTKKRKVMSFGKDNVYNARGIYGLSPSTEDKSIELNYRLNFAQFWFQHFSLCITPTLILIWIFYRYDFVYLAFPIIYYLASDLFFNIKKSLSNNIADEHFTLYLKSIDKHIPNI